MFHKLLHASEPVQNSPSAPLWDLFLWAENDVDTAVSEYILWYFLIQTSFFHVLIHLSIILIVSMPKHQEICTYGLFNQ